MNGSNDKIAVIGMAGRFPGARDLGEFWENLSEGRESITRFREDELRPWEHNFDKLKDNPDFIPARGILNDVDKFDANFFGFNSREAALTDPQHRIWLETAWHAFEDAGCDPFGFPGAIGVFAGSYLNTYLLNNILRDPELLENYIRLRSGNSFQILTGNDAAFIPTKTAYKFNLKGPAVNVQTACSTSLVAISQACQSLFSFESDVCLAGGVCIVNPQQTGYIYQEGAIPSPDGHCRPFDVNAGGTVFSNGIGVVVLKRLDDAQRDKDRIYAVISGWALNNDGSNKVSYTAPGVDGQAEVITMAQSFAGISPEDISYVEAHGTATQLGDPVEIAALTKAFRSKTNKAGFCGIGSVKSNIGHTDAAAGVASFIKACLSAYHGKIPPSINFSEANKHLSLDDSPFYIQNETKEWNEDKPLIIGVSSFGIGGTNAHVIIEEYRKEKTAAPGIRSTGHQIMLLSAKTATALEQKKKDLIQYLKNFKPSLSDTAFTLREGRSKMPFRSYCIATSIDDVPEEINWSETVKTEDFLSGTCFMFPGQGAQYAGMGKELYKKFPIVRDIFNIFFDLYSTETGNDIKALILGEGDPEKSNERLASTNITQPALFIVEYALARLFLSFGIKPSSLIGHSIGEYVAACLSGVFTPEDALRIVIKRGQLMSSMPGGEMMAVRASRETLEELKGTYFETAADNAPEMCSISFPGENSKKVKEILEKNNLTYIPLNTSHAFHSQAFDPVLDEFAGYVNSFSLNTPEIPFISCLSGDFITKEQATSGKYWALQLRNTVEFRKGIENISLKSSPVYLELGPDTHLGSLLRQNRNVSNKNAIIATLGKQGGDSIKKILESIASLWAIADLPIPEELKFDEEARKISLPLYPFERKSFWVDYRPAAETKLLQEVPATGNSESSPANENVLKENEGAGRNIISGYDRPNRKAEKAMEKEKLSIEDKLLGIWESLLGNEELSNDDDFFELGGHSLLALQVLTRIKENFGVNLRLKTFMENPSINELTDVIKQNLGIAPPKEEIVHISNQNRLPLSVNQKRLWIISKLDKNSPAYNIPFTYLIEGKPDIAIFRKTIEYIFNRHHIMYSVFRYEKGEAWCEIIPREPETKIIDYTPYPLSVRRKKVFSFISDDSRKIFDLENGPLYRLYLIRESENLYFFHATISHLVFDGWSWGVFVKEFNHIYNSLKQDKSPELPEIKFHHYDYAEWQKKYESSGSEQELVNYWKDKLNDCPVVTGFPWDSERKENTRGHGEKEYIYIPSTLTESLRKISRSENTTMYVGMLSVISLLLSRYSGETDLCIGTPVANRPQTNLEDIFGMFVNTIALRLKLNPDMNFSELIRMTKKETLEAISYQELPFEKVVENLKPERIPGVNPFFQIAFAWLNNLSIPLELDGIKGERITVDEGVAPFDITFYLWENNDFIEGEIEYNSDILKRSSAQNLSNDLLELLQVLTENPAQRISDIKFKPSGTSMEETKDEHLLMNHDNIVISEHEENIQTVLPEESVPENIQKLIPVWESVLKKNITDPDENFFESGGNSLLAISLINQLEEEFGTEISFKQLVNNPDIRSMAKLLEKSFEKKKEKVELQHVTSTEKLPLSVNQKRMWLINKMNKDIPTYIIPFTYHLKGNLNKVVFRKSIALLFERHPVLFSRFGESEGEPFCEIIPEDPLIQETDLSSLPEEEKNREVLKFVNEESVKTFNLRNDSLYRLYLIRVSDDEYYFHFSVHHIIFDGWSWQIFINELGEIYNSLLDEHEPSPEKPEFTQYDYAFWEKENGEQANKEDSLKYWAEKLEDVPPVLNFPYDFPRKKNASGLGEREIIRIPTEISDKLRQFGRKNNSSLFSTMFSTFSLLIHKYSGDTDICIGTPVAYRPLSVLENIIGMFVNTIVLRVDFNKEQSFSELVSGIHEQALESFAHQDVPFEKIVDIVKPERALNVNPVFQVSFAWQNNLNVPLNLKGLETDRYVGDSGTSPFDLSLYMWENGEYIEGELEYNVDLLKRESVVKLRDRYLLLLQRLVENFDASIWSVPLISEPEIKEVLSFTETAKPYPHNKSIVDLFVEEVKKQPDKTAVSFKGKSLSYARLDRQSNRLANLLTDMNVKKDTPVGLVVDKSLDMVIGILAILKAGGAYLPIDPEYPSERKEFILNDAGCQILLCQEEFIEDAPEDVRVINLNDENSLPTEDSLPKREIDPRDLAYIMYTSGTTGTPKGSLIQHNSVIRLVKNNDFIELGPETRILLTGAIVFDATTFEIWGALLNGGTLFITDKETILKPQALGEELQNNKINTLWLTSALLTQLVEIRTDIFSGLKYLLTGGDVLSPPHINKVRKDNPGLQVINGYGPTENTTFSTTFHIDRDYSRNIPIGKPISNSTAYIFDRHLNYQPVGIIGELCVGGEGLSRGYLNRDELNKSRFIEHPRHRGERLYRTGDLARWLPDGNIEFHGRMDNQLKIRGFRVELEEIETVISGIEGIIETVVKPYRLSDNDLRLIAFMNADQDFNMDLKQITSVIREKLPPYMVPSAFKILHGFPKTINGKTDRKALRFDPGELNRKKEAAAEMTAVEKDIRKIFEEVLGADNISLNDNFFNIGGNSLLAISVINKIEYRFNIEMNLRLFFDSPRIKDLAENVEIIKIRSQSSAESVKESGRDANIVSGEI